MEIIIKNANITTLKDFEAFVRDLRQLKAWKGTTIILDNVRLVRK